MKNKTTKNIQQTQKENYKKTNIGTFIKKKKISSKN